MLANVEILVKYIASVSWAVTLQVTVTPAVDDVQIGGFEATNVVYTEGSAYGELTKSSKQLLIAQGLPDETLKS